MTLAEAKDKARQLLGKNGDAFHDPDRQPPCTVVKWKGALPLPQGAGQTFEEAFAGLSPGARGGG